MEGSGAAIQHRRTPVIGRRHRTARPLSIALRRRLLKGRAAEAFGGGMGAIDFKRRGVRASPCDRRAMMAGPLAPKASPTPLFAVRLSVIAAGAV